KYFSYDRSNNRDIGQLKIRHLVACPIDSLCLSVKLVVIAERHVLVSILLGIGLRAPQRVAPLEPAGKDGRSTEVNDEILVYLQCIAYKLINFKPTRKNKLKYVFFN